MHTLPTPLNNARRTPLRRRRFLAAAGAFASGLGTPFAFAQPSGWPNKPIRFIVPYPPGGGTDIVARLFAQKLGTALGQQVVIDNKPGASTIIGTEMVARAAPDGYTMGLVTDSHAINPAFFPKLPYDSMKDFAMVTQLVSVPLVMVANPSLNVRSLPELIAAAKARPGKINYASIGNGTPHNLAMEWVKSIAHVDLTHIPYKGVAPAVADLVGGQVDVMFTGSSSALPHVKAGKLHALAVSSAKRLPTFPDTPAVAEVLPEFKVFMSWYGMVMPAGTAAEIVQRVSRETAAALDLPDVRERISGLGLLGAASTPTEFAAFMRSEMDGLARLVMLTGVKPE